MLTIAGLITLCLGVWGLFEVATDVRNDRKKSRVPTVKTRAVDLFWLVAMACIAVTAVHSLAASWT